MGSKLLACAAFTRDQNGNIRCGYLVYYRETTLKIIKHDSLEYNISKKVLLDSDKFFSAFQAMKPVFFLQNDLP